MKSLKKVTIPVIDLFAGPGGLGEGFSAFQEGKAFNIHLSIEKEDSAHQTLTLRSFLRTFGHGNFPDKYYQYLEDADFSKEDLFKSYPKKTDQAMAEAWKAELGAEPSSLVHEKISRAVGNKKHWVLLGGPPCQAYSLVGRARLTGVGNKGRELSEEEQQQLKREKLAKFHRDERHTLYKEYLKIVAVHQPTAFVMENVKGILSSKHSDKPIFLKILEDLQDPWAAIDSDLTLKKDKDLASRKPKEKIRYKLFSFVKPISYEDIDDINPNDFIIRSENYGIPQKRHRVIVLGVREDYDVSPGMLEPIEKPYNVEQALYGLPNIRSGLSRKKDTHKNWVEAIRKGYQGKLDTFSDDIATEISKSLFELDKMHSRGGGFVKTSIKKKNCDFIDWISDPDLQGVSGHEARGHIASDLCRYLYIAAYSKVRGFCPKVDELPPWLLPEHKNVKRAIAQGKTVPFRDRFRVQQAKEPATTITAHISKDGHYFVHPDPSQCRSFTVREAARIQTFPDNYHFEGNRTQQYRQIGNAVPPLLANKLAKIVSGIMEECIETDQIKSTKLKERLSA